MRNEDRIREFLEKKSFILSRLILFLPVVILCLPIFNINISFEQTVFLIIFSWFLAITPHLIREYLQKKQRHYYENLERQQTLTGEYKKEPQTIRDLTEKEKEELKVKNLIALQFYLHPIKSIIFSLIIIVSFSLIISWTTYLDKNNNFSREFFTTLLVICAVTIPYLFRETTKEKEIYQDLKLPVKQVVGKLIKQQDQKSEKLPERKLIVRGITFTDKYNEINLYWQEFKEGEEVCVEYSPYTKKIWSIKLSN